MLEDPCMRISDEPLYIFFLIFTSSSRLHQGLLQIRPQTERVRPEGCQGVFQEICKGRRLQRNPISGPSQGQRDQNYRGQLWTEPTEDDTLRQCAHWTIQPGSQKDGVSSRLLYFRVIFVIIFDFTRIFPLLDLDLLFSFSFL